MKALGIGIFLLAWAALASRWPAHVLPGPARVAATLVELRAELAIDLWRSGSRVLAGYGLAVAAALPLAAAMAGSPALDGALGLLARALRAIPPLAWAPLLLLWLGIGDASAVLVVAAGAFFPVLRQARAGLDAAPASLRFAARNLGATPTELLWRVRLPAALPLTFSGLRLGWTLAWMSVVAAELVGADRGLGQRILDARNLARPDVAMASMLLVGTVAAASEAAFTLLERRLLGWRP